MKTILKFYLIHKEQNIYPHFSVTNIKMYIFILINLFRKNLFFGKLIIQERGQGLQNITDNDDKYFQIERNRNFLCFMKYNFTNRKTLSASILTSYAMQEKKIVILILLPQNQNYCNQRLI